MPDWTVCMQHAATYWCWRRFGARDGTTPPHYPWLVAVDPRGAVLMAVSHSIFEACLLLLHAVATTLH